MTNRQSAAIRRQFCELIAAGESVLGACRSLELDRHRIYEWKQSIPGFSEEITAAEEAAVEAKSARRLAELKAAESELFRRAVEGWEEPVYQGGELVGHSRRYSDSLLKLLLQSRDPATYRERLQVQHSGANGEALPVIAIQVRAVETGGDGEPS
ncbi:MAG: hypothetical protein U0821_18555 [Chloroflexota bacterium]